MKVFNNIPYNFFSCLAGGNRLIYAGCLVVIYNLYEREISYRIPRDTVRDAVSAYLSENKLTPMEDDDGEKNTGSDLSKGYTGYASFILRRFSNPDVGWLEEDVDDTTYEKNIVMSEQGIMLAEFLLQLQTPEREEFSGYIFNIYNTLRSRERWDENPYASVLRQVYRNSRQLSRSLKRLSTSIRKIIEKMIAEESLESLTENIISYCDGSFIREYARLTRQNNIHLYRNDIIKHLDKMESSPSSFEALTKACMDEEELEREAAAEKLYDMIENSRRFLKDDYDRIMQDIKHKINVYMQIAVGRARFLRSRDAGLRGSVENAIKYMAENYEGCSLKEELPPEMTEIFSPDQYLYIDTDSLRYPKKQLDIREATEDIYEEMTEEHIKAARLQQQKEAFDPYSKERMKAYIESLMPPSGSLKAEDMPLSAKEDMLCAVSAAAYGRENGFDVSVKDGYINTGTLILRNFIITKEYKE